MSNTPEVLLDHKCLLGEGPVWDARNNRILWVDILNGEIHQAQPDGSDHRVFRTGQMVGAIVPRKTGGLVAAMQHGFTYVDIDNGTSHPITDPEADKPGNRFNDGKCDPEGRFWAGTMSLNDVPESGGLYVLDKDEGVSKKLSDISISNGLAWTHDKKTFYYIDTPTSMVMAYDYDAGTGNISNGRTIITVAEKEGSPDGMTIDTEGMLWIAHWDGWQVTRWDPNTGTLLLRIQLPVGKVTCPTFGGPTLEDLYITSASVDLSDEELAAQPLAGSLFVIRNCGFKGLAPFEFAG